MTTDPLHPETGAAVVEAPAPGNEQATPAPPDSPGVPVTPLFIYLFFMAVAVGLEQLLRLPLPRSTWSTVAGWLLVGAGGVLIAWTMVEFGLAHVNPEPSRPTSALILRGPFRFSRNPTYLGGTLACLGGGLLGASGWVLIFTLPLTALMQGYVIPREERYLGRAFGEEYRAYAARVRRWI